MAERVLVIDAGRVIADGTPERLKAETGRRPRHARARRRPSVPRGGRGRRARPARRARSSSRRLDRLRIRTAAGPAALSRAAAGARRGRHRGRHGRGEPPDARRRLPRPHRPQPARRRRPRRRAPPTTPPTKSQRPATGDRVMTARRQHRDRPRPPAPPALARPVHADLRRAPAGRVPGPVRAAARRHGRRRQSPWQWFVPGIIVMVSLFGTSVAGAYLLEEMRIGSFERFLVTPLDRSSLLIGRALKEVVPLTLQALLIVADRDAVRVPARTRLGIVARAADPGRVRGGPRRAVALAGDGRQATRSTCSGWSSRRCCSRCSCCRGSCCRWTLAPDWLQALSRLNPLTYVVEAERALFAGDLANPSIAIGAAVAPRVAVVGLFVGTRMMRNADRLSGP